MESSTRSTVRPLVAARASAGFRYALGAALAAVCVAAAARGLVPAGLYEIVVTQELPNVAKAGEPLRLQECLTKKVIGSAAAFHVRSENPIRACPISDMRANDDELIYRIKCAQPNTPSAKAKFVNTRTGYEGTITLDMGGKNMTMIERHRARRIGECPNDETASPLELQPDILAPEVRAGRNPH